MRQRLRRLHRHSAPELDITAFMNLMVILIPFLLITAVFSQVNIVEMNLPNEASESEEPPEPPPLQLEIILRTDGLEVGDQPGSLLKTFPRAANGHDIEGLAKLLKTVKQRFPDHTAATLLMEPDISYNDLVQVMDTVRIVEVQRGERTVQSELFPDVALGDAPPKGE